MNAVPLAFTKERSLKIVAMIALYLLGLMFLVFGLNDFLHFIPVKQMPTRAAGQFAQILNSSHYMDVVASIMILSAILFLVNRYVPLGLTLLGPVLVNILLFHILLLPTGIVVGAFATVLWALVAWRNRSAFAGIFAQRAEG